MNIAFWPFCSQQDKELGKFRLDSDSGVRMYCAIADRFLYMGHRVTMVLPQRKQCIGVLPIAGKQPDTYELGEQELNNLDRKLSCCPSTLKLFVSMNYDCLVTTHEFLPFPLRCYTDMPIIVEGILPTAWPKADLLYPINQSAATAVHCSNKDMQVANPKKFMWQFGYDDRTPLPSRPRIFDVLFNSRMSSTNYTGHQQFIEAFKDTKLVVAVTDPTGYGRREDIIPRRWFTGERINRDMYTNILCSSRVVVYLSTSGYLGQSFYEALAAGCCPVCPRAKQYVEILGEDYPYYCYPEQPNSIRREVERALANGAPSVPQERYKHVSYSTAVQLAYKDINELCSYP